MMIQANFCVKEKREELIKSWMFLVQEALNVVFPGLERKMTIFAPFSFYVGRENN